MLTAAGTSLLVVAAALLIAAALHDIAARTIPNWLSTTLAAVGLLLKLLSGQLLVGVFIGVAVFAVAVFLWRRGLMGGGDVKLLGAAALVVPSALAAPFLAAVAIAGGVLALLYLGLQLVVAPPAPTRPQGRLARILRAERRRIRACQSLPYACAIATGALFVMIGS